MNKEKTGKTVRFSIRLPKNEHKWVKEQSEMTKKTKNYRSMNDIITEAVKKFIERS